MNRGQFLKQIVRGGLFTSLALMTGFLVHRRDRAERCRYDFLCEACNLSERCRLPEADRFRLNKAREPKSSYTNGKAGK